MQLFAVAKGIPVLWGLAEPVLRVVVRLLLFVQIETAMIREVISVPQGEKAKRGKKVRKAGKARKRYDSNKDVTVLARKAVSPLWDEALTKARSWGRKQGGANPFFRTNILYSCSKGDNVTIITFTDDGKAVIHEYCRVVGTTLGMKTKQLFKENNIPVHEGEIYNP